MGSHLGELGVFLCWCFDEEEQSLGRGEQDGPCYPLNARLPVASVVSLKTYQCPRSSHQIWHQKHRKGSLEKRLQDTEPLNLQLSKELQAQWGKGGPVLQSRPPPPAKGLGVKS